MTAEFLHDLATLISLSLTVPIIIICYMVLRAWHGEYVAFCKTKKRQASMLLIGGIYISFFGSMVDNLYWGVAWSLDFLAMSERSANITCTRNEYFFDLIDCRIIQWRNALFHHGVFPNIVFRQVFGLIAGALHIHAEVMSKGEDPANERKSKSDRFIFLAILTGFVYAAILITLKN